MAKWAALTVRKLKPGVHAYVLRSLKDPDEVIAFGLTDRDPDDFRNDPESSREAMDARNAAMAPFVESIGADGFYQVIDEVDG